MANVLLDLNYHTFQVELFNLEKIEQAAFLKTCKKIKQMTWNDIYKDKGLRWEEIVSKRSTSEKIFSIRFSGKYRAVVARSGEMMVFLSIHPAHDSAYKN